MSHHQPDSEQSAFESFSHRVEREVNDYICGDVADRSVRVQRTLNAMTTLTEQLNKELKERAAAN